jgi:hypothetical protein
VIDSRGAKDDLLRFQPLAVETLVGIPILTHRAAVDGDAGE